MERASFQAILAEFGDLIGIPDLRPNDRGDCALTCGGDSKINISIAEDSHTVTFHTCLAVLHEAIACQIYPLLLEANVLWSGTGGATIGVVPGSQEVILAWQERTNELDAQQLAELVECFVALAEFWTNMIRDFEPLKNHEPFSQLDFPALRV